MAILKASPKQWAIYLFLAYIIFTALNILLNKFSSKVPIVSTGPILILLLTFVLLVMIYSFAEDKNITRDELYLFLLIIAVAVGIVFALKHFLPQLFSILNNFSGGAFSIIP